MASVDQSLLRPKSALSDFRTAVLNDPFAEIRAVSRYRSATRLGVLRDAETTADTIGPESRSVGIADNSLMLRWIAVGTFDRVNDPTAMRTFMRTGPSARFSSSLKEGNPHQPQKNQATQPPGPWFTNEVDHSTCDRK